MAVYTLEARMALAIEIAEEAGQMIRNAREQQGFSQRLKGGIELVTDVDVAVDTLISQRLEEHFPGEARLSEELSPERALHTPAELRHVAVSIGWMEQGVGKVGVIHAPFLGETFSAAEGLGAFCNQQPIQPSGAETLESTLVGTGFPYQKEQRKKLLPRLEAVLTGCQDVRRNGSAALDLCDVACGRLDAYYESVSPWDFVAGWVIAREAGARVGHLSGVPDGVPADLYPEQLLVTTPKVYDAMASLLKAADHA